MTSNFFLLNTNYWCIFCLIVPVDVYLFGGAPATGAGGGGGGGGGGEKMGSVLGAQAAYASLGFLLGSAAGGKLTELRAPGVRRVFGPVGPGGVQRGFPDAGELGLCERGVATPSPPRRARDEG